MKNCQAIIFDLDGTLIDTLDDIAQSANQALEKLDLPIFPVDDYRLKVGNGARMLVSRCLDDDKQHLVDTVLKMHSDYYQDHCYDTTRPYPGICAMLSELKKDPLKLAVLSNKPEPFAQRLVHHFFGADLFNIIRGQLPDKPLKPDPAPALAIADQLGLPPGRIAFIGDTAVDMQTARKAGMFAVGAAWGFRDRAELLQNGSHTLIDQPSQLLPLLRN